ncbi:unnamed protein product [Caenorhabditis auriculariae]|uniref:Integrase catalytic domain-containing protein n=1 Tax=Caenorhabditis auriculariae TaxID=2777116 RepID=A0A8S1GVS4_9PELO|nr:unnamed protein product [Caenorhabditis auriculariae]
MSRPQVEKISDEIYRGFCKWMLEGVKPIMAPSQKAIFEVMVNSRDFEVLRNLEDELLGTVQPAVIHIPSQKLVLSESMWPSAMRQCVAKHLQISNCERKVMSHLYDNYFGVPPAHKLRNHVLEEISEQKSSRRRNVLPSKSRPSTSMTSSSFPSTSAVNIRAQGNLLTAAENKNVRVINASLGISRMNSDSKSPRIAPKTHETPQEAPKTVQYISSLQVSRATGSFQEASPARRPIMKKAQPTPSAFKFVKNNGSTGVPLSYKAKWTALQLNSPLDPELYDVLVEVINKKKSLEEVDAPIRDKVRGIVEKGLLTTSYRRSTTDFLPAGWRLLKRNDAFEEVKFLVRTTEVGEIWREIYNAFNTTQTPEEMLRYVAQRFIGISTDSHLRDIASYQLITGPKVQFLAAPKCIGSRPMQYIQIDVVEMDLVEYRNNTYESILVVTDMFSGFVFGRALQNENFGVPMITRYLMEILGSYGPPEAFRIGKDVEETIFGAMKDIETMFSITSRYAGSGPDLTREIVRSIYCRAEKQDMGGREHWMVSLPFAVIEYNQTPMKCFDFLLSPFELMFKRRPWTTPTPPWIDHEELNEKKRQVARDSARGKKRSNKKKFLTVKLEDGKDEGPPKDDDLLNPNELDEPEDEHYYDAVPEDRSESLKELLQRFASPRYEAEYDVDGKMITPGTGCMFAAGDQVYVKNPVYSIKNRSGCARYFRGVIVDIDILHIEMLYRVRFWADDQENVDELPLTCWPAANDGYDSCEAWFAAWDIAASTNYLYKLRSVEMRKRCMAKGKCRCGCGEVSDPGCLFSAPCCVSTRSRCLPHNRLRNQFKLFGGVVGDGLKTSNNSKAMTSALASLGMARPSNNTTLKTLEEELDGDKSFEHLLKELIPAMKVPFKKLRERAVAEISDRTAVSQQRKPASPAKPKLTLNLVPMKRYKSHESILLDGANNDDDDDPDYVENTVPRSRPTTFFEKEAEKVKDKKESSRTKYTRSPARKKKRESSRIEEENPFNPTPKDQSNLAFTKIKTKVTSLNLRKEEIEEAADKTSTDGSLIEEGQSPEKIAEIVVE